MCWGCYPEFGQPWDCASDDKPSDPTDDDNPEES